jgi:hypothetical protein
VKGTDDTDEREPTSSLPATQLSISKSSLWFRSHEPTMGMRGEKREHQDAKADINSENQHSSTVTTVVIRMRGIYGLRSGERYGQRQLWLHQPTLDSLGPANRFQQLTSRSATWSPRLITDGHPQRKR